MLNTLPISPTPSSPGIRRRGAQPSNRNALKHGLYVLRNPTPFTPHLNPAVPCSDIMAGSLLSRSTQAIQSTREQIAGLLLSSQDARGLRSNLTWQRAIARQLNLLIRYRKALARLQQPQLHLQFVAAHALDLLRYDFRENGIPRAAYSFRGKPELSDLNSPDARNNYLPQENYSFRGNAEFTDFNSPLSQEDGFPFRSDPIFPSSLPASGQYWNRCYRATSSPPPPAPVLWVWGRGRG
jgi:hypothetical protein